MIVDSIFPIPIANIIYDHHYKVKKNLMLMIDKENKKPNVQSKNLYHFFDNGIDDLKKIQNKDLQEFIAWCELEATNFVKNILCKKVDKMIVTEIWINLANTGAHQIFHSHSNSYVSGTYYLNHDNHANLEFENPLMQSFPINSIELENNDTNQFNASRFVLPVSEGMLSIWPSYLRHGYDANSKDNRISVSMNFMPIVVQSDHYRYRIERI